MPAQQKVRAISGNFTNSRMTYDFEVRSVKWHHNRGNFIFARQLGGNHDIYIPDGSLFGNISVYHYEGMRNLTDEDGTKRPDIFVFCPTSMEWLKDDHFLAGQEVQLIVSDEAKPQQ